jgi:hypothetical protein
LAVVELSIARSAAGLLASPKLGGRTVLRGGYSATAGNDYVGGRFDPLAFVVDAGADADCVDYAFGGGDDRVGVLDY